MIQKVLLISICLVLFLLPFRFQRIESQSAEEIAQQIEQEQARLEQTRATIQSLEQELANAKEGISQAQNGIPFLEATIKQIDAEIQVNTAKQKFLTETNAIKKLQTAQRKLLQKSALSDSYQDWRSNLQTNEYSWMLINDQIDPIEMFKSVALGSDKKSIDALISELESLETDIQLADQLALDLQNKTINLVQNKKDLESQITALNNTVANNSSQIGSLSDQQATIQKNIATLMVEQQRAAEREAEILRRRLAEEERQRIERESKPRDLTEGNFYFSGYGRDLYQGHGVGMSQWGAHGAGLAGKSAEEIIKIYYANVTIEKRPGTIDVQGVGVLDSNDYAAGIGEVPDKACGSSEQVKTNPQKYALQNAQSQFGCWPEETIKAQVIAARSYALSYGGPICSTAACQVYQGGEGKRWAADETKDMVIVSNGSTETGSIIKALYSADNSQGYGTANNDTIFQTLSGEGTPFSYLRAVNDSAFATPTQWTTWNYQSNTYKTSDILDMLDFIAQGESGYSNSIKSSAASMYSLLKQIKAITFERDASERIKKVIIEGTGGNVTIGGWWFKNFWNTWRDSKGDTDFIFSQRFYAITK